jgi:hypothetical protein
MLHPWRLSAVCCSGFCAAVAVATDDDAATEVEMAYTAAVGMSVRGLSTSFVALRTLPMSETPEYHNAMVAATTQNMKALTLNDPLRCAAIYLMFCVSLFIYFLRGSNMRKRALDHYQRYNYLHHQFRALIRQNQIYASLIEAH